MINELELTLQESCRTLVNSLEGDLGCDISLEIKLNNKTFVFDFGAIENEALEAFINKYKSF